MSFRMTTSDISQVTAKLATSSTDMAVRAPRRSCYHMVALYHWQHENTERFEEYIALSEDGTCAFRRRTKKLRLKLA